MLLSGLLIWATKMFYGRILKKPCPGLLCQMLIKPLFSDSKSVSVTEDNLDNQLTDAITMDVIESDTFAGDVVEPGTLAGW